MTQTDDLFRFTFRDSPIGMAVVDAMGHYVELNRAFCRILGLESADLAGRHFAEFTHPDDLARDVELLSQLAAGDLPYYQIQKRFLRKNGDTVWTRVTVTDVKHDDEGTPHHFMLQVEDVTEIRRARDLLERRALYDHLTGLANRTLLIDRLTHAIDSHAPREATVAVIFLDVDHFKVVNDSLGHEAGDTLLTEIAARIQAAVRSGDTVARLGGDEFVIVLENIPSQAAAEGLLAVITAAVQEPVMIGAHEVEPTVSAGLALATATVSAETLVRHADMAMYVAKQSGRARIEVFNERMRDAALAKLSVETELRSAVKGGELVIYYQPVVDLETTRVVGFEALVRWNHPTRGLLLPHNFIAISEESNLVIPLGAYVLGEACRFLARHPEFPGRVFVNVSTRQIGAADLTHEVRSAVENAGITPERLALEITESGVLMASPAALSDLESLHDYGVDLVIDDFGTGYSALSSVLQNPIAGIKLARDFTLRLGDRATGDRISTTVATLADSLDMYGIIEGIETGAQHALALQHGWRIGQGFLFGYPVPESQIRFDADGTASVVDDASFAELAQQG